MPYATTLSTFIFQDTTHPVEGWVLFLCPLSAFVPFEAASVETGFFASTVFTIFLAADLVLSSDGFDFEIVMVAFLLSLHLISLSFPCLLGVFLELAAFDSLIFFKCLDKVEEKLHINIYYIELFLYGGNVSVFSFLLLHTIYRKKQLNVRWLTLILEKKINTERN